MKELLMMTPGPTSIKEDVLMAMSRPLIHPSMDMVFFELYKETCDYLKQIMKTDNEVLILNGEGILGLEAACASLIEPSDKVLILENGIFGEGFADFVKMYQGECTYFKEEYDRPFDVSAFEAFLKENHDFKLATMVHCETPSGLINPIEQIIPLLHQYGIITIVDAVSSLGGIPIHCDELKIDLLLGGSQKCLSAPPGLSFLSMSPLAKSVIHNRKTPIAGFYANLSIWDQWYEKKKFPYTQPVNDIYAFHKACKNLVEDLTAFERHKTVATVVRDSLRNMGLILYPKSSYSDTVTAFTVPDYRDPYIFRKKLEDEFSILIAGSLGVLSERVLRFGHMGENCYMDKAIDVLKAIESVLNEFI